MSSKFTNFMEDAFREAQKAADAEEIPVGAVIVKDSQIIARGQNFTRRMNDPTAHAEIVAIREAAKLTGNFRLQNCQIYVTLEPCAMCAGAIAEARIERLYFGAEDPKSGGTLHGAKVFAHPQCHHKPEIYPGIDETRAQDLLREFFNRKRK